MQESACHAGGTAVIHRHAIQFSGPFEPTLDTDFARLTFEFVEAMPNPGVG
jgi:hypothetical protein